MQYISDKFLTVSWVCVDTPPEQSVWAGFVGGPTEWTCPVEGHEEQPRSAEASANLGFRGYTW